MPSGGHAAATMHSHKSLAARAGSSKHVNAAGGGVGGTAGTAARRNQVNIKGLRVDLPLDDEDYLVPSPQSPQQQVRVTTLMICMLLSGTGRRRRNKNFGTLGHCRVSLHFTHHDSCLQMID